MRKKKITQVFERAKWSNNITFLYYYINRFICLQPSNVKHFLPRGVNLKSTVTFKNKFNEKSPFAVNCSGNISLEETRNYV